MTDEGYNAFSACRVAGITYRQADYWARTGFITPSISGARGSGTQRRYSFADVVAMRCVAELLDRGMSLQAIRRIVPVLQHLVDEDLVAIAVGHGDAFTLTDPGLIIDAIRGGHVIFPLVDVARQVREGLDELERIRELATAGESKGA
jgi:DNA-binding transcriptional MerR regulator